MDLRSTILNAMTDVQVTDEQEETDEIVEALRRQLDVLEGTAVIASNVVQLLMAQVTNLRAELDLFGTPPSDGEFEPAPKNETVTLPSGARVEATLPEEKRLPDFCLHDDALVVDTISGPQRVCPTCAAEMEGQDQQQQQEDSDVVVSN